jgi:hypothetical protein
MPPFKKKVPLVEFDTRFKRATVAFAVPITLYLVPAPHFPCAPLVPKFAQFACAPERRHEPHIEEEAPISSMTSTTILTNTASGPRDVTVPLTGASMKAETGHFTITGNPAELIQR